MNIFRGVEPGLCRRVGGGVESVLLASLVQATPGERLAELGSGCGESAIRVALANPGVRVDALELQEVLSIEAQKLAISHGVADRVRVVTGDVRHPPACMIRGGYSQLFCNPPFFLPEEGRLPTDGPRAVARFELTAGLKDFMSCAARLLTKGGWFHLVHRPERLVEILAKLQECALTPTRLIPIHDPMVIPAILILVTARKGGKKGGLTLEPAQWIERA
ncbi:MAG: hypothetical protein HQL94_02465 [Magnetococcales bacterium]|nr:hypothetical protein [Magnetococcales bacterium]MBF0439514.1 hypothetical protein [Magnetococcales bacterium]